MKQQTKFRLKFRSAFKHTALLGTILSLSMLTSSKVLAQQVVLPIQLKLGSIADYGATPWYTDEIILGTSQMKLALDTGANFFLATSDLCSTTACNAHNKVNTTQPGFKWIDQTKTKRSFGSWGDMYTYTGEVTNGLDRLFPNTIPFTLSFYAAVEYDGAQFQYLAWDGGIGFPSNSAMVNPGSDFYFQKLWKTGFLKEPVFSMVTNTPDIIGEGIFYFGGVNPQVFDAKTQVRLEPKLSSMGYLWGTELIAGQIGDTPIPAYKDASFFLDSGSSRFKGDAEYIQPILNALVNLKGPNGNLIFTKIIENGQWLGLEYATSSPMDYTNLPNLTLQLGQSCNGQENQSLLIGLSPEQYSYLTVVGERKGKWVVGAHILPGVGGLLVGSTLMDKIYSEFHYEVDSNNDLYQGNMYIYRKNNGENPVIWECVS